MKKLIIVVVVIAVLAGVAFAPLPVNDTTTIRTSIAIDRPPDVVFGYVTTPANWPKWHPSSLAVSGASDHSLSPGEQVTEDFRVAGREGRVLWTALTRDAPRRWVIEGSDHGRKAGVITYTLAPEGAGTRFARELTYGSPNLVFSLLNRLTIRAKVDAESTLALQRLKQVLESAR